MSDSSNVICHVVELIQSNKVSSGKVREYKRFALCLAQASNMYWKYNHQRASTIEINSKLITKGKSEHCKTKQLILLRIQAGAIHHCDKGGHAVLCYAT